MPAEPQSECEHTITSYLPNIFLSNFVCMKQLTDKLTIYIATCCYVCYLTCVYSHYVIYTHIATLPAVVIELFDDLCDNYKIDRKRPHEEEWPPDQPSSIVNLALIHYKSTRTQQEVIEISKRCKEGASHVDKLTSSLHSNVTTDIKKLFIPEASTEPPKRILIEGAPGIGKTVLSKEIAYQWANGELLQEHKLVFLMFLRDPRLRKVKSVKEILKLFASENSFDLYEFVKKSHGKNVAFVFDGFDEYPVALQQNSFITNLIKCKNDGRLFVNSTVVVTSRPTATLFLHRIVDRRIEILGFPKEERDKYISLSLRDSLDKFQEIDKYLKQHPIINNLCYIPLHLAILIYLFQQDSLPEILTEMNEYFIINTIYRYLERHNLTPPGVVKVLTDLPSSIVAFIYKLSQLAFTGLSNNQLVFTYEEIKKLCPKMDNIPGAINGFGLLQAVQHYSKKGAGRTTSVNFLHFTMQEYLAALHVSTLSSEEQSSLMWETFWDGQFSFMWIMYVGIVGVKSNTFASFVALNSILDHDNVYNDKRKCLHLFQCYVEAKSVAELPKTISSMFTDGKITLSGITLLPQHISSLIFFMHSSSIQQWKVLKLDRCNLGEIGMNSLLEHVIKNDESISTLKYVDLSGNESSPWGVYCAIIRHCCVNSLTLCGDEGMIEYTKEIIDSLQLNTVLQSLTLCEIRRIGFLSIKEVLSNNATLKELNVSWMSKGTTIIHRKLRHTFNSTRLASNVHEGVVDINILYDGYHECSSKAINMSNKDINDDAVCLIIFGLYNNTAVQKFDLSCNNITDDGAVVISDYLKHNSTLKKLNLSRNRISSTGLDKLSKCIEHAIPLEYVDLSRNKSSPWGVYCAIIRHCCVNSLTLCGDEGMIEYTKEIIDSLELNTVLQSLTLCKIGRIGVQSIKKVLSNNTTLKELNVSWMSKGTTIIHRKLRHTFNSTRLASNVHEGVVDINILYDSYHKFSSEAINMSNKDINDDAVCLIIFGLYNNTAVQKFDLSCNNITDDGAVIISDYLKHNSTLKKLNLSRNRISSVGLDKLSKCIEHAIPLEYVDLSRNKSSPWGVYCAIIRHCCVNSLTLCGDEGMIEYSKEIIDSLELNTVLQSLTLCKIGRIGVQSIKEVLSNNTTLKELNVSWMSKGTTIIHRKLRHTFNSTRLASNVHEGVVDINILYDGDHECSSKAINMSNKDINDDAVCLIKFGLYNNTALQKLDLSCNNITDDGAVIISYYLKHNSTLKKLNLSRNHISSKGLDKLSECIEHAIPLEYVDLSGNKSSPWGVYCAIIRHCCVNSLTLCGDEGIKEYVKEITDSLQRNAKLQLLTLCASGKRTLVNYEDIIEKVSNTKRPEVILIVDGNQNFNTVVSDYRKIALSSNNRVVKVKVLYDGYFECLPKTISLPYVNEDTLQLITFGLHNNTTMKKLNLSYNFITYKKVVIISDCLKHNNTIQKLNLSHSNINIDGMTILSNSVKHAIPLEYVDLSGNKSSPWGVYCAIIRHCCVNSLTLCGDEGMKEYTKEITDSLQLNTVLQSLTLCKIGRIGLQSIKEVLSNNTTLKELNVSWMSKGTMIIPRKLRRTFNSTRLASNVHEGVVDINILYDGDYECSSEAINMSNKDINDDEVCLITFGLYNNTAKT